MNDIVNQPAHYTAGGIECIDALEAATEGLQGQEAFCTANAIKYLWRWKRKNGAEDLKKARWYINRLLSALEPAPAPTVEIEDTYGVCESPQEVVIPKEALEILKAAGSDSGRILEEPRWLERSPVKRAKGYKHKCPCGIQFFNVKEHTICICGKPTHGEVWRG